MKKYFFLAATALMMMGCGNQNKQIAQASDTPCMDVLHLFTAPDVPAVGKYEIPIPERTYTAEGTATPEEFPGEGINRYPMLYIGEGCNRMFLVKDGKVIWTYDTGGGWEYDDIWMKKNGNIVFSRMQWAGEVTPNKEIVWRYDCAEDEELHTIQPISETEYLLAVNAPVPYAIIINNKGEITYRHDIPYDKQTSTHGQFRRFRMTPDRHFLVTYLSLGKVVEYDEEWNEVWRYEELKKPWAAIRLLNGNTLISDERKQIAREVNKAGETVWEFDCNTLPEEYRIDDYQTVTRLKNGNTIFCARGHNGLTPQCVEVTKEGEVVWVLKDWRELGPCTAVQILNDPGDPEIIGQLQR